MSFWRKSSRKDDDAPPPIERRRAATPATPAEPGPRAAAAGPSRPEDQPTGMSVLAAGLHVEGILAGRGTVRVEGSFHGQVRLDGTLVVAKSGQVQGETLVARRVVVEGLVRGPLLAEHVEIGPTGRVWGDVTTTAFVAREGAFLRGRVRMEEHITLPLEALPPAQSESPPTAPGSDTTSPPPNEEGDAREAAS